MFTLDDMMNINDNFLFNFDYSGYGLGYKPTKYNMVGGYLVEKDPERIQELMNGDDNDMSKVLRAYERAKDEIINGKEYDDEEERHQDLQDIQKNISSIERKIERKLKEEPESNIVSEEEEINEQLEYYEENLENLSDQEYEEYMGLLAYLHEKEPDEKEKDILLDKIKDVVDFWDALREEKHEEYREDYLKPSDIEEMVKKININEGYGKKFEHVIINIQDKIKKALTNDSSEIKNNDEIERYKKHIVYYPLEKDKNGKPIKWGEKQLSEFLVYDLSQDKNDIEVKYYNIGTYKPSENEIKKDGLILQQSKFMNSNFYPLYTIDDKGDTKLYNIWSVRTKDWVNNKIMKDTYTLYQTSSGNYAYHINADNDLKKINSPLKGTKGEELFILQPQYKQGKDNMGKDIYYIPYNKLKKIYL